MPYDVPSGDDVKDTATSGGLTGVTAGIGETVGRGILGPGLGTAGGGILAASMLDGNSRDTAAALAVERGMNELLAGAGSGGGQRQGVK